MQPWGDFDFFRFFLGADNAKQLPVITKNKVVRKGRSVSEIGESKTKLKL